MPYRVDARDCVNCTNYVLQIHGKGLKFGIYGDFGTHTCGGYPGNEYYLEYDAQTYANWTVDYFKMDGCNSDIKQYDDGKLFVTLLTVFISNDNFSEK